MADAATPLDEASAKKTFSDARHNDVSSIEFPYLDLDTAVEVARAAHGRAGLGACEVDELAAQMNQTLSGAFRAKTATAKIFGLVEKEGRSGFRLSAIGRKLVHPDTEAEAKAEAFLTVPLYKAIFEQYRGHLLPPLKALEREMASLGVAPKQTGKARQAFERSAKQAGFFSHGEDRLVQPRLDRQTDTKPVEPIPHEDLKPIRKGGGDDGNGDLHPFIQGLLKTLPPPETDWSKANQAKWLQTASSIFGLIYRTNEDDTYIDIEMKRI